ncbi:Uncharacterised protein [Mycobacteroides abscessus subsp. abscessus]|nr:Uncharacterised protein [Mycobacteroides abscessus subsp. abscessus]
MAISSNPARAIVDGAGRISGSISPHALPACQISSTARGERKRTISQRRSKTHSRRDGPDSGASESVAAAATNVLRVVMKSSRILTGRRRYRQLLTTYERVQIP